MLIQQENEVDQTNDIQEPETVNDNVTLVADQTGSPTESNVSKRDYDRLIAKVRNSGTLFVLAGLLVIFTTGCNVGWRQGYVNAIMQCHLGLFLLGLGVTVVRLSQFLNYVSNSIMTLTIQSLNNGLLGHYNALQWTTDKEATRAVDRVFLLDWTWCHSVWNPDVLGGFRNVQ